MRAPKRLAAAALAALAAGCTLLPAPQDPSRFYTLSARVPEAAHAEGRGGGLSVVVGTVTLPDYLDRNEIAVRVSPSRIDYVPAERWAEPLTDNFTRVLVEDLGNALGSERVASLATNPVATPDFRIEVVVVRFEARADGGVHLTARWAVRDATGAIVRIRQSQHVQQAAAATTEGRVEAMSAALGDLALEIAAALTELASP
jgi:uncharacterized lipoprotein YmbA